MQRPAKPKGKNDEKAVLASVLKPDRCYVTDCGFAKFELFNQINAAQSSYICRARNNSRPKNISEREIAKVVRTLFPNDQAASWLPSIVEHETRRC